MQNSYAAINSCSNVVVDTSFVDLVSTSQPTMVSVVQTAWAMVAFSITGLILEILITVFLCKQQDPIEEAGETEGNDGKAPKTAEKEIDFSVDNEKSGEDIEKSESKLKYEVKTNEKKEKESESERKVLSRD